MLMGMFDSINCEYDLPGLDRHLDHWQTKSLSNNLSEYLIKKDGTFWFKDPFSGIDCIAYNFYGKLIFYTSTSDKEWFEYEAVFEDGKIKNVRRTI